MRSLPRESGDSQEPEGEGATSSAQWRRGLPPPGDNSQPQTPAAGVGKGESSERLQRHASGQNVLNPSDSEVSNMDATQSCTQDSIVWPPPLVVWSQGQQEQSENPSEGHQSCVDPRVGLPNRKLSELSPVVVGRLPSEGTPSSSFFAEDLPCNREISRHSHSWDRTRTSSANGLGIPELPYVLTPDAGNNIPGEGGTGRGQVVLEKARQGAALFSGESTQLVSHEGPSMLNGYVNPIQIHGSPLANCPAALSVEQLSFDGDDSPRMSIIERNSSATPSESNTVNHLRFADRHSKEIHQGPESSHLSLGEGGQSSVCPSPYPSAPSRPCSGVSMEPPPHFTYLPHPTPSTGNSPMSFVETPVWAQATPMSMGPTVDGAPTRSPWRAASSNVSPTHGRNLSGVPQTPSVSPLCGESSVKLFASALHSIFA